MKKNYGNSTNGNNFELEYQEWQKLDHFVTGWCSTGAGARFYFEEMAKKGINLAPIAIDLCVALESSLLGNSKTN